METAPCGAEPETGWKPLTPAEYAALRSRLRTPGDGVLTGAALEFFARLGSFYGSARGVAAVLPGEGGEPFVMESFGAAPGFLGKAAALRRPGGRDFAMFRPLFPGVRPPRTFFMALD